MGDNGGSIMMNAHSEYVQPRVFTFYKAEPLHKVGLRAQAALNKEIRTFNPVACIN